MLKLIVAKDQKNGIGLNNKLPWYVFEDLTYFRKKTLDQNIIMGSNTCKSLSKALPRRTNYVLSSKKVPEGFIQLPSVDSCFNLDAWVIGGQSVYEQLLHKCKELYVTEIQGVYTCDTFFPEIPEHFKLEDKYTIKGNFGVFKKYVNLKL